MPEDLRKFARRVSATMKGGVDPEDEERAKRYQEEYDKQFAEEERIKREAENMREAGLDPAEEWRKQAVYDEQRAKEAEKEKAAVLRDQMTRKYLAEHDADVRRSLEASPTPVRMLAERLIPNRSKVETTEEAADRAATVYGRSDRIELARDRTTKDAERVLESSPIRKAIYDALKAVGKKKLISTRREPTFERYYEED